MLGKIEKEHISLIIAATVILIIGIAIRVHFLNGPIRYDEAYTFLHYASLPFQNLIADYSLPNNHILHTLLVKITTSIWGPWEWSIRIPAFIAGICLLPAIFLFGTKVTNVNASLWACALTSVSSALVEYSVNARGYSMVCLFSVILFMAAQDIIANHRTKISWLLFILASIAGLFCIPVMVFPICTVSLWILLETDFHSKKIQFINTKKLLITSIIIGLGALLCYTPVILKSGMKNLISNRFVEPLGVFVFLEQLPQFCWNVLLYFHRDLPLAMSAILVGGFILGSFRLPRLAISFLVTLIGLILLQRVIPDVRILTYGLLIYLFLSAVGIELVCSWLLGKQKHAGKTVIYYLLPIIYAVSGVLFLINCKGIYKTEENVPEAEKAAHFIINNFGRDTYLFATVPTIEPFAYYGSDRNCQRLGTEWSEFSPPQNIITIVNLRVQTLDELIKRYKNRLLLYKEPELVEVIDSIEIYKMELNTGEIPLNGYRLNEYLKVLESKNTLTPDEVVFLVILGNNYFKNNSLDEAVQFFQLIVKHQPDGIYALQKLGLIYQKKSLPDESRQYYMEALRINPENIETLINLALLEKEERNIDLAKQIYLQILNIDGNSFQAHVNLGDLYFSLGDLVKAESHFEKALLIQPTNGMLRIAFGNILLKNPQKLNEALEHFQIACQLLPELAENIRNNYVLPIQSLLDISEH